MIHFLLFEINQVSSQHLPDSNTYSCPSAILETIKRRYFIILKHHTYNPPAMGQEQWEVKSVWSLIATSEHKCPMNEQASHIFLQRKESRHTPVQAHTWTQAALSW